MIVHTGTHLLRACVPRAVEKIRENDGEWRRFGSEAFTDGNRRLNRVCQVVGGAHQCWNLMLRATIAENTWKAPRMSRNSRSSCTFLSGSVAPLMARWGTTNRFSSSHILESLLNGPNHWSRPDQGSGAYLMLVSSTDQPGSWTD